MNDIRPLLEALWPRTAAEATADAMIRFHAAQGLYASTRSLRLVHDRTELGMTRWFLNFEQLAGAFDRVRALRVVKAAAAGVADDVARDWWLAADAGDSYGEMLYDWAKAAGLDVQSIAPNGPITTPPAPPEREVPVVWASEDGETWWAKGHVDPLLMVFACFVEQVVNVGRDEAVRYFAGPWTPEDLESHENVAANLTKLTAAVHHYWATPDPDNDERQIECDEDTDGAEPWTVLEP